MKRLNLVFLCVVVFILSFSFMFFGWMIFRVECDLQDIKGIHGKNLAINENILETLLDHDGVEGDGEGL